MRRRGSKRKRLKQLTVRGFSPALSDSLIELARKERISLNAAAVRLLEKGAEAEARGDDYPPGAIGHSLDKYIGTMTQEEADAIARTVAEGDAMDLEARRQLGEL